MAGDIPDLSREENEPVRSRRAERIRSLQLRTRTLLRANTPPQVIAARARDAQVDDQIAYEAVDLALRMGEALLTVGVSASATTAAVLRIGGAYGLTSMQAEVTFTSIKVTTTRPMPGGYGVPITAIRMVKVRSADYTRLAELNELAAQVGPDLPPPIALERLDAVLAEPHPYRRWIVTLALAGMAAAVVGLLGGGLLAALLAGTTTTLIDRLQHRLNRWGLPTFFQHVAGAGLATCVAVVLYLVEPAIPLGRDVLFPSLVVAGGVTVLLAGLAFVGAAEDAIAGFYLTASARGFEVVLLTAGMVIGIGGVLALARGMNVDWQIISTTAHELTQGEFRTFRVSLVLEAAMAATIAACFAIASYARPAAVLVVAGSAVAAYSVFALLRGFDVAPAAASAIAGLLIGFLAEVAGSRAGIPTTVISVCSITPLLPGFALYRAMTVLVDGDNGLPLLLEAVSVALALAAGVALGSFFAMPLAAGYDRYDRRIRRKARDPRD